FHDSADGDTALAEVVMKVVIAACTATLGVIGSSASAWAGPSVCVGSITDVELLHRVKQDAYFTHNAPVGKRLRLEYHGCGYRFHVGEPPPAAREGDLLLVAREGRVMRVVHQR